MNMILETDQQSFVQDSVCAMGAAAAAADASQSGQRHPAERLQPAAAAAVGAGLTPGPLAARASRRSTLSRSLPSARSVPAALPSPA